MVVDDDKWYTQRGGRLQGPYSRLTIHRYLLLGRIKNCDRVSKDGEMWEPITQVPELIPEELLDLQSDMGWKQFLRARDLVDQRQESNVKEAASNQRDEPNEFLSKLRIDWGDSRNEYDGKISVNSKIPVYLFALTVVLVGGFFVSSFMGLLG